MGIDDTQRRWDAEHDVIVVGSGAGGMTAALCAAEQGLSAVVIEKEALFGGTSAVSGGGIWVPCNDDIPNVGGHDTPEEALAYLKQVIGDEVPEEKLRAYVREAPEMLRFMAKHFDVKFRSVPKYPDYYTDLPGAKPGYRSMEPVDFDATQLGAELNHQRPSFKGTMLMGRVAMTQIEAHILFSRGPGWLWLTLKMMLKYWLDIGWRMKTRRDRRQTLGQAMTGALRGAMLRRNVPLLLQTVLESLVQEQGRVVGVSVVDRNGRRLRYRARRGVVLACGGFESNPQMREQYLAKPTNVAWCGAPPINHGDGIRAGQGVGAAVAHMDRVWGSPTVRVPGAAQQVTLFVQRGMPGSLAVNRKGRRFVNEAVPYPDFRDAMYADDAKGNGCVPCWFVFDATCRHKYPMGVFLPGQFEPDSALPKDWLDNVYYRADTLAALAAKIGVDAAGLADTVAKHNEYARTGVDLEFGKGGTEFERYYSDLNNKPNPCIGPLVKPPFYAIRVDAGEIGTKGGLVTDARARVLRDDGSVIEGLYAIGNTSDAVMGPTYPGAGSTLGPAMTFGYLAAFDLARSAVADNAARITG